jgi:hypothetical protein
MLPRGTPFMKDLGTANEVDIISAGDYNCWMYGNYMPNAAIGTEYTGVLEAAIWPDIRFN